MPRDHRDLVIEMLADAEEQLRDELIAMTVDRDAYRLAMQEALHGLFLLAQERDRLRDQHARLLGEYRALCVRTLRDQRMAAA